MIHLTMTGYYAGRVLCGARKDNPDDTFAHAMYWHDFNHPDLCKECKDIWEDDTEDDNNER